MIVCRIAKKIMLESEDRANRIKCKINLIGGASSEMGPLAWMMGSNDWVTENDCWCYADRSTSRSRMSIVKNRRLTNHDPRSRAWITKLQGPEDSRDWSRFILECVTQNWWGPHTTIHHKAIGYWSIRYGTNRFGAIHYGAIYYGATRLRVSAVNHVMQEVNHIDRQYAKLI